MRGEKIRGEGGRGEEGGGRKNSEEEKGGWRRRGRGGRGGEEPDGNRSIGRSRRTFIFRMLNHYRLILEISTSGNGESVFS